MNDGTSKGSRILPVRCDSQADPRHPTLEPQPCQRWVEDSNPLTCSVTEGNQTLTRWPPRAGFRNFGHGIHRGLLADRDPPALTTSVGQRVSFADATPSGRLFGETDGDGLTAPEIVALATEIERPAR